MQVGDSSMWGQHSWRVWREGVFCRGSVPWCPHRTREGDSRPCRGRKAPRWTFWWTWSWPSGMRAWTDPGLSFPAPLCHPTPACFSPCCPSQHSQPGNPEWLESLLGSLRPSRQCGFWSGQGSILTLGPEGCSLGRGQLARECVDGGPTLFLEMGL